MLAGRSENNSTVVNSSTASLLVPPLRLTLTPPTNGSANDSSSTTIDIDNMIDYHVPDSDVILRFDDIGPPRLPASTTYRLLRSTLVMVNRQVEQGMGLDEFHGQWWHSPPGSAGGGGGGGRERAEVEVTVQTFPGMDRWMTYLVLRDTLVGLIDFFSEEYHAYVHSHFQVTKRFNSRSDFLLIGFGWLDLSSPIIAGDSPTVFKNATSTAVADEVSSASVGIATGQMGTS